MTKTAENPVPIHSVALSDQVYGILLKEISQGIYPPGSLLPSEKEFAARFGVSRPSVRVAMVRLVERGYLRRQKGIGTYVAPLASYVNPINQDIDVQERVRARGSRPGFRQLKADVIPAKDEVSNKLKVPEGSHLLYLEKLFTADDVPIILFINYIPEWVYETRFTQAQVVEPGFTEPFFEFYAAKCSHPVKYLASVIRPGTLENDKFHDVLEITDHQTPLLVIEDVGYDKDSTPLFYSIEHLAREASAFQIIRYVD
jgi:GntR family transcriptional regulator